MTSRRMNQILEDNVRFAKQAPYNFCDRWCARCPVFIQRHCSIYQQEMEEKMTCAAHGREEGDQEVLEEVFRWQFEGLEEPAELEELDLDDPHDPELNRIKAHMAFVEEHPLRKAVESYRRKAHLFLEQTSYGGNASAELKEHFEAIAWYHKLLPVKLRRALCGLHEPMVEGDISLHDAVAQFAVCKKGIRLSTDAFRALKNAYPTERTTLIEMSVLLQRILSGILLLEEAI